MNQAPWEIELERCYEVFADRHVELREQLQARIIASGLSTADRPVQRRLECATTVRRRWLRSGLAVAASLLFATALWTAMPLATPTQVFGLDDLPKRLQGIHSIYLHSTNYYPRRTEQGMERPPTLSESFVERPRRHFRIFSDFTPKGVSQRRVASDGERHFEINALDKTAVLGKEQPLAAEYKVEVYLQNSLIAQLLGGNTTAGFQRLRGEPLGGIQADVYERIFQYPDRPNRTRIVVWLEPASGLPLRVEHFSKFGDEPEYLMSVTDKIEVDGAPPDGAFDFSVPEGFTLEERDATADSVGSDMSGGVGAVDTGEQAFHALRFCFNLDDRAALVCWARFNDLARQRETELAGPLGRKLALVPTSSLGDRTYDNYFLRVDPAPRFHWHWSLVVPTREKPTLGDGQLVFSIVEEDGIACRGTLFGTPLRFDREQLARWIVAAQRLTMPADAPEDALFTLEQLESLAEKFRQQD